MKTSTSLATNMGNIPKRKSYHEVFNRLKLWLGYLQYKSVEHEQILEKISEGVLVINQGGFILFANQAAETIYNTKSNKLSGTNFGVPVIKDGMFEIQVLRKNGEIGFVELRLENTVWKGEPVTVVLLQDITERKSYQQQLEYQAYHDSLTGLENRAFLNSYIEKLLEQSRREKQKFAVLFLDLDRFKKINDTLGHGVGDEILKIIAGRIKDSVRKSDVVVRQGGDEFIIILTGLKSEDSVGRIARILIHNIQKPLPFQGMEFILTVSIGISIFPDDGKNADGLLSRADRAMFKAKELGKNNFQFCSPAHKKYSIKKLKLETSLRGALENDELYLCFQPRISLATGLIKGMEALIRWKKPGVGSVSPGEFIPVMREAGLESKMNEWVILNACRQLKLLNQQFGMKTLMAVNISPEQFCHSDILGMLFNTLEKEGLDPRQIELEITEDALMEKPAETEIKLKKIHEAGIQISIDDFGTGYSSLAYLQKFKMDNLKIDRSFIQNIPGDVKNENIVKTIVSLAKTMGLNTIVEGVETEEQLKFVRDIGCDEVQGFYLCKPLPPMELGIFLALNYAKADQQRHIVL